MEPDSQSIIEMGGTELEWKMMPKRGQSKRGPCACAKAQQFHENQKTRRSGASNRYEEPMEKEGSDRKQNDIPKYPSNEI